MIIGALLLILGMWAAISGDLPRLGGQSVDAAETGQSNKQNKPKPLHDDERIVSAEERADAIVRATLWRAPAVPAGKARLSSDPAGPREITCRFKLTALGGTSPKFDCELESGEEIRVKYGRGPEGPAEAAATRLLTVLGFGADDVSLVERVRCYGCPSEPFSVVKAMELARLAPLYRHTINYNRYQEFSWVAVERKFNARPIETREIEGWSFHDLDKVDANKGGAPREHVDALRLLSVLLAHWDNKAENHRLVCLSDQWPENTPCPTPFLMLQDVGATFGPTKVNLDKWANIAIWDDRPKCILSMKELPFSGATFGEATVTERGRDFTARLLQQLSDRQLRDLFENARFDKQQGWFTTARPAADWAAAFRAKVQAIADGPACPR